MDPTEAAAIVALRPAIENLIQEATENPEAFFPLAPQNEKLLNLVVNLSRMETPSFGQEIGDSSSQGIGEREGFRNEPSSFNAGFGSEISTYGDG